MIKFRLNHVSNQRHSRLVWVQVPMILGRIDIGLTDE